MKNDETSVIIIIIIRCQIWNRHWRPCLSKHLCHQTTLKKIRPLLCPPVAELQRLSRNVILCLPLSRLPSTFPVKDKNSKPLRLHTCPKNSICLFLIVCNSDLLTFPSLNTFTLGFFSVHEILNIRLINQQSNITQESLLSWRSPLRSAKFMLAGLIPHRNQWAKRKGGQQRLPSSRTIVIALDNLELYFLEKVKWETYNFRRNK